MNTSKMHHLNQILSILTLLVCVTLISGQTTSNTTSECEGGSNDTTCRREDIIKAGQELMEYKIAVWMAKVGRGFIYTVGLVGNFLSGLVMFQKRNRKVSCCFYMGVLSVVDTIPLLLSLINWVMVDLLNTELGATNHVIYCKVIWPILTGSTLSGSFLIVAMTLDRLLAITFPLKTMVWCSVKRAKISCALVITLCFLFRLPYIELVDAIPPMQCVAYQGEQSRFERVYYVVNLVVSVVIPFIGLLTCNSVIIHTLCRRGRALQGKESISMETDETDENMATGSVVDLRKPLKSTKPNRYRSSTVMLLLVSFSFLLFTTPLYIFYIVYKKMSYMSSPQAYANFTLATMIVYNLFQFNHCANFYLYCISGTKFRNDLKKVFHNISNQCHSVSRKGKGAYNVN